MATGKTDDGRSQSFLEALAVPRPVSRILMWVIGLGICQVAWNFLDPKLLAFASGQAVTICTMCLAAVWGFREKATDILSNDEMSSDDLSMVQRAAKQLGILSIRRAMWIGFCLSLSGSAAVSVQLAGFVMQWMVLLGGIGLAEALYAFWLTSHMSQQLKDWRDLKQLQLREALELKTQLERMKKSAPIPGCDAVKDVSSEQIAGTLIPVK